MPRKKGTPKTGGRRRGTPNKATVDAKQACAEIVDDPEYRRRLLIRARSGKLAPAVETMLWHYAKGKPVERHEIGNPGDFPVPTTDELTAQLKEAAAMLERS